MVLNGINLNTDTSQYRQFSFFTTAAFFSPKYMTHSNMPILHIDLLDTNWVMPTMYSLEAENILNDLLSEVNNYTIENHNQFVVSFESLKTIALNLSDETEAIHIATCCKIAVNSFTYWKNNLTSWTNYFSGVFAQHSMFSIQAACNVKLKELGGADIRGAISGGVDGALIAGVHGAVAGVILGSAVNSSKNILWQAARCDDGPIGRAARWLDEWM